MFKFDSKKSDYPKTHVHTSTHKIFHFYRLVLKSFNFKNPCLVSLRRKSYKTHQQLFSLKLLWLTSSCLFTFIALIFEPMTWCAWVSWTDYVPPSRLKLRLLLLTGKSRWLKRTWKGLKSAQAPRPQSSRKLPKPLMKLTGKLSIFTIRLLQTVSSDGLHIIVVSTFASLDSPNSSPFSRMGLKLIRTWSKSDKMWLASNQKLIRASYC